MKLKIVIYFLNIKNNNIMILKIMSYCNYF